MAEKEFDSDLWSEHDCEDIKGIHDGWSNEELDNEYQVLLEELKKTQERNK